MSVFPDTDDPLDDPEEEEWEDECPGCGALITGSGSEEDEHECDGDEELNGLFIVETEEEAIEREKRLD